LGAGTSVRRKGSPGEFRIIARIVRDRRSYSFSS
jgi:hypothetical protein